MAFKFPDKDPDERLDYTVDWSRYLERDNVTIVSMAWKIEKADGTAIAFDQNYAFQNDVLVLNENATAIANGALSSSTALVVDSVSGVIRVGHKVTGTGITDNVYVTAVDGVNITLSSAVSVADNTSLSFSSVGLVRTSDNGSSYFTSTTATAIFDKGEANKTYTLVCEITTTSLPKTSTALTTNRRVKLKVRERV